MNNQTQLIGIFKRTFANRIIDGATQHLIARKTLHMIQRGMPATDRQRHIGLLDRKRRLVVRIP